MNTIKPRKLENKRTTNDKNIRVITESLAQFIFSTIGINFFEIKEVSKKAIMPDISEIPKIKISVLVSKKPINS